VDILTKRLKCLGCVALLVALSWPAPVIAAKPETQILSPILAELDALMGKNISDTTPGCAVGIQHKDMEVLRAYGQADLERHVSNTVDSVFNVGSVSKQFTAAAVLLLANEGKLALDDDVRKFLPELPVQQQPITIDHLLSHTSGLRDFRATDWMLGRDALPQNNNDVLAYAARQRALNHPPGDSHLYTNTGYALLTIIIERASGRTFAEFTRDRLFEPAGMSETHWEDDIHRVVGRRSVGYTQTESAHNGKPARFEQMPTARHTIGHGGLLSAIGDMLRWNAALSRGAFGPRLAAQLEEPARLRNGFALSYARGVFVGEYRGLREVQHSGYNGTYTAWVGRYPQADLSIALLCNGDGDEVDPHSVADLFLPKGLHGIDSASNAPPAQQRDLSAHSGVYRNANTARLALWNFPEDAEVADSRYVRGPSTYEFNPEDSTRIVQHEYGNASRWIRLPEWTPSIAALSEFQGRFVSDELLAGYDVVFDGKQLTMGVLGLSELTAPMQSRSADVFEAPGILVEFKRDMAGKVSGLALAPNQLNELPFRKVEVQGPLHGQPKSAQH